MKIIYKTGDLLQAEETLICHGCNARGQMGSGIAKQIRATYPTAYEVYRATYERQGNALALGQVITVDCGRQIVANAISQNDYGNDPKAVYVSYDAIQTIMGTLNMLAVTSQVEAFAGLMKMRIDTIAFPLIGAGLANGSWSRIAAIIEATSTHFQPVVYTLDGVVPTT